MPEEVEIQRSTLNRLRDYFTEVRVEMKRVTWPGKQEVYGTTLMVIITTFLFGFFFWVSDFFASNAVSKVLNLFLHRS